MNSISKTPIIIAEVVWSVNWISYVVRTLLFLMREFAREFSQRARPLNSSERLWLVSAFISATESPVIGYNAQRCINASVSGSAPANADLNLTADDLMHWTF